MTGKRPVSAELIGAMRCAQKGELINLNSTTTALLANYYPGFVSARARNLVVLALDAAVGYVTFSSTIVALGLTILGNNIRFTRSFMPDPGDILYLVFDEDNPEDVLAAALIHPYTGCESYPAAIDDDPSAASAGGRVEYILSSQGIAWALLDENDRDVCNVLCSALLDAGFRTAKVCAEISQASSSEPLMYSLAVDITENSWKGSALAKMLDARSDVMMAKISLQTLAVRSFSRLGYIASN